MAGNILQELPNFEAVVANGLASRRIDAAGKLHGIMLRFLEADGTPLTWAEVVAAVEEITIEISADVIYRVTPRFFGDMRNFYQGSQPANGEVYIPLKPTWWANRAVANQFAWGMAGVPVGATVIQCRLGGNIGDLSRIECAIDITVEDEPLGAYFAIDRFSFEFDSAGKKEITALPANPSDVVLGYLLHKDSGVASEAIKTRIGAAGSVGFQANSVAMRTDMVTKYMDRAQVQNDRTPLARIVALDFNGDNSANDFLPLRDISRQSVRLNFANAPAAGQDGTFDLYRIRIGGSTPVEA